MAKKMTLREAREMRGLTKAELARRSHVPYPRLEAMENGRTPGDWNTHVSLVLALGVTLKEVFPETAVALEKNLGPFSPEHKGKIIVALFGKQGMIK